MDLLGKVKAIMKLAVRLVGGMWAKAGDASCLRHFLGIMHHLIVMFSLPFHCAEVLHLFAQNLHLHLLRQVGSAVYLVVVLFTPPAQIRHWPPNNNEGDIRLPKTVEGRLSSNSIT